MDKNKKVYLTRVIIAGLSGRVYFSGIQTDSVENLVPGDINNVRVYSLRRVGANDEEGELKYEEMERGKQGFRTTHLSAIRIHQQIGRKLLEELLSMLDLEVGIRSKI